MIDNTKVVPLGVKFVGTAPAAPSFWETDIEVVKTCGVLNKSVNVQISAKARSKMSFLMKKFPRTEWLGYLVGTKTPWVIDDIVIPKQRVTAVRVVVDGDAGVPVVGVIHSHHDMGNGFSHTDDEYINQNHDISLCITHNKITGHVRVKTECNRYSLVPVDVSDQIVGFDLQDFEKEITDHITEHVVPTFFPGHYGNTGMELIGYEIDDPNEMVSKNFANSMAKLMDGDLMEEINAYRESITFDNIDDFYITEFKVLSAYINSIGNPNYDFWENKAFNDLDNVYTENYYRLIDEISSRFDSITEREMVALNKLVKTLDDELDRARNEAFQ